MPSFRFLATLCAVLATTLAQTTSVTSLFLYGFEGENIVASVVSAAPDATTYFINCAPGTDSSDCGFGPGITVEDGSSTFAYHLTESDAFTADFTCAIESQTATCVEAMAGPEANFPGTSTEVISDISDSLLPVTITAGLDLLSGASATTTGSASTSTGASTDAATGASATATSATKTTSGTASGTSATGAASSSAAATGAAGRMGLDLAAAGLAGLVGVVVAL